MRYNDDFEYDEHDTIKLAGQMALVMTAVIAVIVGAVVFTNKPKTTKKNNNKTIQKVEEAAKSDLDGYISGSTLTSDQLNIWNISDSDVIKEKDDKQYDGAIIDETTGQIISDGTLSQDKAYFQDESITSISGDATDFSQTLIKNSDGTEEWVDIDPELEQNDYLLSGFSYQEPMMKYMSKGTKLSKQGVDVNESLGEVDFYRLKAIGVDYVMVRIGTRGYGSGKIVIDDKYKANMDAAQKAGLGLGVYFISQAVSKEEILEEVDAVLEAVSGYSIEYPVMVGYDVTSEDITRIDVLDKAEKTKYLKQFLTKIKEAGYKAAVYGTKSWLLKNIDLKELKEFDTCYAQNGTMPDYPYEYSTWQYADEAEIAGIKRKTKLYIYISE